MLLDQDADEALQAADDGAVQHDRAWRRAVFAHIFGIQALGMLKSTCIVPHCHCRPIASFSVYSILGP
jgi:hypothetical protein